MKTLRHLEKKVYVWFLIALCTGFFILRLPSLIEPYWYGDEGIYQVISLALQNGRDLYAEAWDNKPPLLYVVYTILSGDQFSVRLLSLIFGIVSLIVFFFLSRKLFDNTRTSIITTTLFALLFGTPYLEGNIANAENFILLPVLTSALLIYKITDLHDEPALQKRNLLFTAGLLLGIAFLLKIVAVFDFIAFFIFMVLTSMKRLRLNKHLFKILVVKSVQLSPYIVGFFLPIFCTFLYFTFRGTLPAFIESAFFGNVDYVSYGNTFIIPQGLLLIKLFVFVCALLIIVFNSYKLSKPLLFISLWIVFALFSAFFSQRPYTHYLLVLLPSFVLLAGSVSVIHKQYAKIMVSLVLLSIVLIALRYFNVYGVTKTLQYYQNTIQFLSGQKSVADYQAFFDPETPRDYELVSYINNHTDPSDEIFIWGDSPQIYALTKKLPPGKYTVAYHITEHPGAVEETQAAIDKVQPKFIITLSEAPPLPFYLPAYTGSYGIKGAAIYERTY